MNYFRGPAVSRCSRSSLSGRLEVVPSGPFSVWPPTRKTRPDTLLYDADTGRVERSRVEDVADGVADAVSGSLLGGALMVLELGEELLDRVEIGGVFGQEEEPCAGRPDHLSDGASLVGAQIVHDDDVAGFQTGNEDLFDIDQEALGVDRTVEQPRRLDPVMAERGQEGHGVPVAERRRPWQALSARRPAPQRRHVGLGPGLVDEDQAGWVDARSVFQPLRPAADDIRPALLAGNQRLFLKLNPAACTKSHTV
jgi:hypothetical protein